MRNKMMLVKKSFVLCTLAALSAGALTGCGSDKTASANGTDSKQEASEGNVKKIKFGSGTINYPFCFIDEDGNLAGYEYDLAKELDNILPQYEFEMIGSNWEDLATSVKNGKMDITSWQIKRTPEREKEYLFSDDWVSQQIFYVVVAANNDRIHSIADLQDDTVNGCGPSEYTYQMWTEYIEAHPEQNITLISSDEPFNEAGIAALQNGSTAAAFGDYVNTVIYDQQLGGNVLKMVGEPYETCDCYYMINKDEPELKEAIDGALKELKENGTFDKVNDKWFGSFDDSAYRKD